MNQGTFSDYHNDDQRVGIQHVWGCPVFGCYTNVADLGATGAGLFYDWKMSGYYYNDYAGSGVGSPITT